MARMLEREEEEEARVPFEDTPTVTRRPASFNLLRVPLSSSGIKQGLRVTSLW